MTDFVLAHPLGHIKKADWDVVRSTWDHIQELVPEAHVQAKARATIETLRQLAQGHTVGVAWSGGKDSQALRTLVELSGIPAQYFQILVQPEFEFTAQEEFYAANRPAGCDVVRLDRGLEWVLAYPRRLFPNQPALYTAWSSPKWQAQHAWAAEHGVDLLLMGRRRQDGNNTGKAGFLTSKTGVITYCGIRDWLHEEVFALLSYHNVPCAPCYHWKAGGQGFDYGTEPWPLWTDYETTRPQAWAQVIAIEPALESFANQYFPNWRTEL